jgi:hypothetical protein
MKHVTINYGQSGVALVVSLILLFVMTLLAVATFSNAHIQERSANNLRLQSLAFEAASAGASSAINFLENHDAADKWPSYTDAVPSPQDWICGSLNHQGWYEKDADGNYTTGADGKRVPIASGWVYEDTSTMTGSYTGTQLRQRMYCFADEYSCDLDTDIDCSANVRPPRSQLFVQSQGRFLVDGDVVSERDVEVRLDIGADWTTGDGCGALCFPGCNFYEEGNCQGGGNPPKIDCLNFAASEGFTVSGGNDGGPAVTTGCDAYTNEIMSAIDGKRLANYEGGISTTGPQNPWDSASETAKFRDAVKADAQSAEITENCEGCYYYPVNSDGVTKLDQPTYGTEANPEIIFVEGDAEVGGTTKGYGILFVTGKLHWNGTIGWNGLVVAIGGHMQIDGGGNDGVALGSVVVLNLLDGDSDFGDVGFQIAGGGGTNNKDKDAASDAKYAYDCDTLEYVRNTLLGTTAQGIWDPGCERGPASIFDAGPTQLVIKSWRENIGWREEVFGE